MLRGTESAPVIVIDALTVRYGDSLAVDDLSLSVAPGEIFGFLGPNGAGKSTTIRCLLDLVRPDTGAIAIWGLNPTTHGSALRARMGYLPGDLELMDFLTGRETLDLYAGLQGQRSAFRDETLARLRFSTKDLDRRIRTYSSGMRQMIGIAVALQHEPELLILDEPTTGLDPLVRAELLHLLQDRRAAGCTIVFSSHVLSEVREIADRVALIHRGRMRLVETMASLAERLPRRLRMVWSDGRSEERILHGPIHEVLHAIQPAGLVDLEIRSGDLADLFRSLNDEIEA
ncbi:MAG: ABC transporter ATP-binding protein [Planctomycetes bacterium]|nr:ABC transporter ATP-binding protein [Planctomycetota bacterium]